MKKILLGLGTLSAAAIPVVAVVSCSGIKEENKKTKGGQQTNTGTTTNGNTGTTTNGNTGTTTNGNTGTIPNINPSVANTEYDRIRLSLQDFSSGNGHSTTTITEDPFISGYLKDVVSSQRTFKVFNNGLFKVKIETSLIGPNHIIASDAKALLMAKEIADQINIGPAINDLPKGIQILNSTSPQSLGGQRGVQVSLNGNANRTFGDRDIKAFVSLVAHEYGHHETMWDNQKLITGKGGAFEGAKGANIIKLFRDLGYTRIASLIDKSVANKAALSYSFVNSAATTLATAYNIPGAQTPQVFADSNYPFSLSEITTRTWNILSYKMSQSVVYQGYDIPAFLTSDQTMRHHAQNSIFGTGKTNTNIQALYDGMLKYVNGLGTKSLSLKYDSSSRQINGIEYNSFGSIGDIDSIQLFKDGTLVKKFALKNTKGLFGHKSELFSETQTTKDVYEISSTPKSANAAISTATGIFTLKGFKGATEVDISGVHLGNAIAPNGGVYPTPYLQVEGNHLLIK